MVIKVDPKDRISVTEFPRSTERFFQSAPIAKDPTIFEPIIYKCFVCNQEVVFEEKHFKKHSHLIFSNLSKENQKEINQFLKSNNLKFDSCLDFHCPKCKKPVSIYYSDGYGGKHGDYIVQIELVLEIS